MKKNYRGWKLTFSNGVYTATKNGFVGLNADSRVGIERLIDAREYIEWQDEAIAIVKKANQLIRKLKQLACEAPPKLTRA